MTATQPMSPRASMSSFTRRDIATPYARCLLLQRRRYRSLYSQQNRRRQRQRRARGHRQPRRTAAVCYALAFPIPLRQPAKIEATALALAGPSIDFYRRPAYRVERTAVEPVRRACPNASVPQALAVVRSRWPGAGGRWRPAPAWADRLCHFRLFARQQQGAHRIAVVRLPAPTSRGCRARS